MKIGCKILDHQNAMVRGSSSKKELKKMYDWVSPNTLIPVHGEYRLKEHHSFQEIVELKIKFLWRMVI